MASRPINRTAKHRVVSGSNSQSPMGADYRFKEEQQRRKYGKRSINNSINLNGLQYNSHSISQDLGVEAPLSGAKVSEEEKQEEQDLSPNSRFRVCKLYEDNQQYMNNLGKKHMTLSDIQKDQELKQFRSLDLNSSSNVIVNSLAGSPGVNNPNRALNYSKVQYQQAQ